MPYSNHYIPGDRLVECDICGFTYRWSDIRKGIAEGQKGFSVCPTDFDPIHPRETTPTLRPKKPLKDIKGS